MSDPADHRLEPGERRPAPRAGRLDRPPSARYATRQGPGGRGPGRTGLAGLATGAGAGPIVAAGVVAVAGAALLTFLLGIVLVVSGTFVVSLVAGAAIGLLVAGAAVPPGPAGAPGPAAPPPTAARLDRAGAGRLAIGLALAMIVLAAAGTWILARDEGGVMDPLSYLWTTFGFGFPAEAVVAVLGAVWGAANGPVRWRD